MAKRVQCLDIWDKDWFIDLDDHYKLFYQYIEDNCSEAGIWAPQKARFERLLSQKKQIDYYKFIEQVNSGAKRIVLLPNGNWLLTQYFSERQGFELNIEQGFHRRVVKDLIINKALDEVQGIINIHEAVEDFNDWNTERKRKAQEKLKRSTGLLPPEEKVEVIHANPDEKTASVSAPPRSGTRKNGTPTIIEKEIQIPGKADSFIYPPIIITDDGSDQIQELEKFFYTYKFDTFCRMEKIADQALFKGILQEFAQRVIKEVSPGKPLKPLSELTLWFNRWFDKVKVHPAQLQSLVDKHKEVEKIPIPRQL